METIPERYRSNVILYKNLSALRRRHPSLYAEVESIPISSITCDRIDIDDSRKKECLESILAALAEGMDFLYLAGFGDGSLLAKAAPEIIQGNRGVLVIEPLPNKFAAALAIFDFRELLASRRIFWAVGKNIEEQIDRIWEETLCYAAAKPKIVRGDFGESNRDDLVSLIRFIEEEGCRRKKELAQRLKDLPAILKRKRKDNSPPRVWTYEDLRNKAKYSLIEHVLLRTLLHYLRRLGFKTEYTALKDGEYYPPYYRILKMAQFEPDLIFLCNEAPAYESALGEELSRSLPIPKVIWFADDPIYGEHLLRRHKTSPDETYLIADYEWAAPLIENGADAPRYMPGAATRVRRGKQRGVRGCEIIFVGQVREQSAFFRQLSPEWKQYCRQVVEEKLRFPRKKVREVMAQFPMPGELPSDRLDEFRQKLLWEANTQFRLRVVRELMDCDLRIYGNADWQALLPPDAAQRCYRGVLPFKRLFDAYRNAKITLNIHSLQSYTCMNVRDFDVPAAGGFLLSDWLPKADEIYAPGFADDLPLDENSAQEVFFYRSLQELKHLVEYFLAHEEERRRCIERARLKVMSRHTYEHRAQWLGELFYNLIEK
ncbi:MAG: glycosyltransferase [Candidatus Omnitrophota bacterium]